jgi:hypothetical protein
MCPYAMGLSPMSNVPPSNQTARPALQIQEGASWRAVEYPKIDWSSPDYVYPTLVLLGCAVVDSAWQACPHGERGTGRWFGQLVRCTRCLI